MRETYQEVRAKLIALKKIELEKLLEPGVDTLSIESCREVLGLLRELELMEQLQLLNLLS